LVWGSGLNFVLLSSLFSSTHTVQFTVLVNVTYVRYDIVSGFFNSRSLRYVSNCMIDTVYYRN
jgi:hypothetical protein